MKQLSVSEKCNGCGVCMVSCTYLTETKDGKATPVVGRGICESDLDAVKQVVDECPVQALSIIEGGMTSKKGKEGIKEIVKILKKKSEDYEVKRITREDVPFEPENYSFHFPWRGDNEDEFIFSSEYAAKSEARREFERLCFSESAYKPKLKEMFVQYKVRHLKKYYSDDSTSGSVYVEYIKDVEAFLKKAKNEIELLSGNSVNIPESWSKVYLPAEDNYMYKALDDYELQSERSEIIADLMSDSDYRNVNWYVDWMRFNDTETEEYGFFRNRTITKWSYSRFHKAVEYFERNLTKSAKHKHRDIEEFASSQVNHFLQDLENRIRKTLKDKVIELEKIIK